MGSAPVSFAERVRLEAETEAESPWRLKAIESYKRAQEIYPAMQSPKIMIEQIEQLIKQQLI